MDEIEHRALHVLRKLAMVSEAPASRPLDADNTAHAKPGTRVPAGVRLKPDIAKLGGIPPQDRSLHDHYRYLWETASSTNAGDSDHRRHVVVLMAERALADATHRRPDFQHEDTEKREDRVRMMWAGVRAIEVAFAEGTSVQWVRKIRRTAGLVADTGLDR